MISLNYAELSKPLYHGSVTSFTKVDLAKSAPMKDFGCGFYTTNDFDQAKKFAKLKASRVSAAKGFVLTFSFTPNEEMAIAKYEFADESWFDFVLCCRGFAQLANSSSINQADIIIGPVANDAVGIVLNNFTDGVYGGPTTKEAKDTAIRLLLTQNLHNQVFFGTQLAIDCLVLTETTEVANV